MKRFMTRVTAVLAVFACVSMVSSSSAYAAGAGSATIVGTGTISPGLTDVPRPQTVSFSGTGTAEAGYVDASGEANVYAGPVSCSFTANGSAETTVSGGGEARGNCNGNAVVASISASCDLTYTRTGGVVAILGSCRVTINSALGSTTADANVTGVFVFVPTSANPVQSYALAGQAVLTAL